MKLDITKTITAKLVELRNAKHYKQEQVAEHLDITQSAYNHIESGKTLINAEHLVKLAKLYQVHVGEFFGEKAMNFPQNNSDNDNGNLAYTIHTQKVELDITKKLNQMYEKRIQELEDKVSRKDKKIEELMSKQFKKA